MAVVTHAKTNQRALASHVMRTGTSCLTAL